jgi:hypothetical protein
LHLQQICSINGREAPVIIMLLWKFRYIRVPLITRAIDKVKLLQNTLRTGYAVLMKDIKIFNEQLGNYN